MDDVKSHILGTKVSSIYERKGVSEDTVIEALKRRGVNLSFPNSLEDLYEAETRVSRCKELKVAGIIQMIFVILCFIPDSLIYPDAMTVTAAFRFGIFLPFAIISLWLLSKNPPSIVREGSAMLSNLFGAIAFFTIPMVSKTPFSDVVLYMAALSIIYSTTVQKLSYPYLIALGILTVSTAWIANLNMLKPNLPLGMVPNFLAFTSILCLFASYSLERRARHAYLHSLLSKFYSDKLKEIAVRDELTGLYNRHALNAHLQSLTGQPSSPLIGAIMVDIDYFKQFNDTFGHEAGDSCLKLIAETLADSVRPTDQVFRLGGEEFLIVLENTDIQTTASIAERLRMAILNACIPHKFPLTNSFVTASFGCANAESSDPTELTHLIASADAALYRAKSDGRNRVCLT